MCVCSYTCNILAIFQAKMSYKEAILKHAPTYWEQGIYTNQFQLSPSTEEYRQISYEVRYVVQCQTKGIAKIVRIQNVHDLGQLLIREQLLLVANPGTNYYRVRRFIKVRKAYYETALKYNLDHRRCGLSNLEFRSLINHTQFAQDEVLVAVLVVTANPDAPVITPSNNLEYFIDYVIYFS